MTTTRQRSKVVTSKRDHKKQKQKTTDKMKKHFFSVLWETKTTTGGKREYTKDFPTEAEAAKFARAKRNNPKTAHVEMSEQETEDTPERLHVTIIRMYIKF